MSYKDSYDTPFGGGVPPVVTYLLIANALVFLLSLLPGVQSFLALTPANVLRQPWTPFTYMFVHAGGFHLLFNLIVLFFFGRPLEERWGPATFLKYYLVAGLGGAVLSFLTPHASIVGASGALNGLLIAFAMIWPDSPIHLFGVLPVKAKWLVAFLAAFSVFAAVGGAHSGVAHWAHLGGFAAGFLYLKSGLLQPSYGSRSAGSPQGRVAQLLDKLRRPQVRGERPTPVAPKQQPDPRAPDDIDRILDKISAKGLKSLTPAERKQLEEVSRRYRI
jgi:membrane associated rhomboid family serine protease